MTTRKLVAFALAALVFTTAAEAVTMDMVSVGNPGNAPDTRYNAIGFGFVNYNFQIGKYEITADQYTEFLNSVARSDPNGLYDTAMSNPGNFSFGTNIQRTGSSPNYSYSVAADWANRPVNYVSFWDAARFANWLHNGQPMGAQGPATTEAGAYHNIGNQMLFGRNAGAKFFIPTEDEWYKTAYHDKTAGLAASYFEYPMGAGVVVGNDITETTNAGNNANFNNNVNGSPYFRTEVGEFELSDSPYGTFDQGGNVFEWNETTFFASSRGMRGGAFDFDNSAMRAISRSDSNPDFGGHDIGFRIASMVIASIPGDFNEDGKVDAADFIVWRKTGGTPQQYDQWRANFGKTADAAGSAISSSEAPVPEPASRLLLTIAALALGALQRRQVRH